MRWLFKKQDTSFVYNKYYLLVQDKWVRKMNSMSAGLSRKMLIYLLILFVVVTAGFFVFNIYTVFSTNDLSAIKETKRVSKTQHSKNNTIKLKKTISWN